MSSAIETQLSQLAMGKPDWRPVKFGEVAFEPKESVKDALKEGIEHVVGLEHIETEDIHLRRSNSIEESTTFSKKFSPGDVLFGRRRAYLKKAAQADFMGICSGDIIVMRANAEQLMPELLPFIVNNDKFFDWAITHSAGGLSPRCKFKDLANHEFLLPPKAQQVEIAKLFWAMDEVIQKGEALSEKLETLRDTNREKLFTFGMDAINGTEKTKLKAGKCGLLRSDIKAVRFFDYVEVKSGQVDPEEDKYSGLFQIGSERIEPNTGRITEYKTAKELGIKSGNYLFTEKDIIYSKIRPYFKKVADPNITGLCSADIYPLRPKNKLLNKNYLFYYLLTEKFTHRLLRFQNRTGMPKVNREELGSMYIPLADLDEQNLIVETLSEIDVVLLSQRHKQESSRSLQKSLINQVF